MSLSIRPLRRADLEGCLKVIASLPRFFAVDDGVERCAQALGSQGGLVAAGPGGDIVGFVTWKRHGENAAEITWMAVHSALRHRGVGTSVLKRLEPLLAAQGYQHLSLMTSASSHTFEATRVFWKARGYAPILELDGLWDTDTALVLSKALTR